MWQQKTQSRNRIKQYNHKLNSFVALLLVVSMLSGCSGGNPIVAEPLEEETWDSGDLMSGEADYLREGYYAPNAVIQGDSPSAPAPQELEPLTAQEVRAAAEQAEMKDGYVPASAYTKIAKGDLNMGIVVGEKTTINPLRCTYLDMMNLNTLVYEGLVVLDGDHKPQRQLADNWTVDGDTWTFTLRSNVRFHDGSLVTPEDVIASYNEIKNNTGSYWYPLVSLIRGMAMTKENEVSVKGVSSGYMLLYAMTFPVVKKDSMEELQPYGTGPYMVSQYDIGNAIRLEANPIWWKRSSGEIDSIVGLFYRTQKLAIEAMEKGEIDTLASEYPTASLSRNLSDRMTIDYSTLTYEAIVPNLRKPVLAEYSVRQALMYGIDRSTLASTVYTGMVQESEVPVVPGTWLYEPQAAQYNYNPEKALQILYDDGWADPDHDGILQKSLNGEMVNLSLKLLTVNRGTTSTRSEAAEAIATQLRLIGVEVVVQKVGTLKKLHDAMNEGSFDLALCAFELSEVPNLYFLVASTGESNYQRYKSDEMDALLRAAYDATKEEELQAAMSKIQLKFVADLPVLGLFFRNGVLSSRKAVVGLSKPRRGYVLDGIATVQGSN